jgi:hypothetical protein
MDSSTEGLLREDPCPDCRRDGYFDDVDRPTRIRYSDEDLGTETADAYFTYERFGNSKLRTPFAESHFAHPLLLVSKKIYEVFVEESVPNVKFEPVDVV